MAEDKNTCADRNLVLAKTIAEKAASHGGRVYFVGGYVRDFLMGIPNKDIDIEVHGLLPEVLEKILSEIGNVTVMGVSFGIFGLAGADIDIAMPRKERATGRGHRDFTVDVDPFIGVEAAAERRDFTINSMMMDVLTGDVKDPYGGREDMNAGIIRCVNRRAFAEDPLRVLRGAQFAARFNFTVEPETVCLARQMPLDTLPCERIFGELKKALLKADKPSRFFDVLQEMNQLDVWFLPVKMLIGLPQNPVYHPEGDVYIHTMQVLDRAASLRRLAENPTGFMMAALVHDFGKIDTTEFVKGAYHSYKHEVVGLSRIREFMTRISGDKKLCDYVLNMTELHMMPNAYVAQNASKKAYMNMFDKALSPNDLLLLAEADGGYREENRRILNEMLTEYRRIVSLPSVVGKDLIDAGYLPSPLFKDALGYARKLHLSGIPKELALKETLGYLREKSKETKEET